MARVKTKAKARKVVRRRKGCFFGVGDFDKPVSGIEYKQTRAGKRATRMAQRQAKVERKAEEKESKRRAKITELNRRTELANAVYRARSTERRAREAHPVFGGILKGRRSGGKSFLSKTKRSRISMF